MGVMFWAIVVVAFVIAEIATVQLVSIWFAAGALITLFLSFFYDLSALQQFGIFTLSSGLLLLLTIPLLKKYRKIKAVPTNSELDIGKHVSVIETVDAIKGTGRVTLNGVDWCAVPENENEIIPEGSIVIVKKVMGAKLIVTREK